MTTEHAATLLSYHMRGFSIYNNERVDKVLEELGLLERKPATHSTPSYLELSSTGWMAVAAMVETLDDFVEDCGCADD